MWNGVRGLRSGLSSGVWFYPGLGGPYYNWRVGSMAKIDIVVIAWDCLDVEIYLAVRLVKFEPARRIKLQEYWQIDSNRTPRPVLRAVWLPLVWSFGLWSIGYWSIE